MADRILVIDNDAPSNARLVQALGDSGYRVVCAANHEDARRALRDFGPHLVVANPDAPGLEGWHRFHELCRAAEVPCIIITGNSATGHKVRALRNGADHVITKPFSTSELEARIRATLRRIRGRTTLLPPRFDDGLLSIDLERERVERQGRSVSLSPTEFRVLRSLLLRRGWVIPYRHILQEVWGPGSEGNRANLAHYVHRLRSKLEEDPQEPRYIRTHWGVGYRFDHLNGTSKCSG